MGQSLKALLDLVSALPLLERLVAGVVCENAIPDNTEPNPGCPKVKVLDLTVRGDGMRLCELALKVDGSAVAVRRLSLNIPFVRPEFAARFVRRMPGSVVLRVLSFYPSQVRPVGDLAGDEIVTDLINRLLEELRLSVRGQRGARDHARVSQRGGTYLKLSTRSRTHNQLNIPRQLSNLLVVCPSPLLCPNQRPTNPSPRSYPARSPHRQPAIARGPESCVIGSGGTDMVCPAIRAWASSTDFHTAWSWAGKFGPAMVLRQLDAIVPLEVEAEHRDRLRAVTHFPSGKGVHHPEPAVPVLHVEPESVLATRRYVVKSSETEHAAEVSLGLPVESQQSCLLRHPGSEVTHLENGVEVRCSPNGLPCRLTLLATATSRGMAGPSDVPAEHVATHKSSAPRPQVTTATLAFDPLEGIGPEEIHLTNLDDVPADVSDKDASDEGEETESSGTRSVNDEESGNVKDRGD
ncbi:hypothetical protein BDK51DRAFT_39886 [Blyttiomyces helicus]|uniref:Uncharacterized protein n=1 Tax=Blyttiomyces helicus TaxID=388810 RepID=A0A4P9W9L2_9FUNG|nr:hypothetical protein BDK51DRAFT_39886 [Blyttiomyces helicus]|eukprot:RKO89094.1 hypothetical protein BDK51DRAFT_39886 [Blyttiomyces helicus]